MPAVGFWNITNAYVITNQAWQLKKYDLCLTRKRFNGKAISRLLMLVCKQSRDRAVLPYPDSLLWNEHLLNQIARIALSHLYWAERCTSPPTALTFALLDQPAGTGGPVHPALQPPPAGRHGAMTMPTEFSLYPPRRAVETPPRLRAVGHKNLHRCKSAGASAGRGPRADWVTASRLRIRAVRSFGVAAPSRALQAFVRPSSCQPPQDRARTSRTSQKTAFPGHSFGYSRPSPSENRRLSAAGLLCLLWGAFLQHARLARSCRNANTDRIQSHTGQCVGDHGSNRSQF